MPDFGRMKLENGGSGTRAGLSVIHCFDIEKDLFYEFSQTPDEINHRINYLHFY
jgi:hypothetical protein